MAEIGYAGIRLRTVHVSTGKTLWNRFWYRIEANDNRATATALRQWGAFFWWPLFRDNVLPWLSEGLRVDPVTMGATIGDGRLVIFITSPSAGGGLGTRPGEPLLPTATVFLRRTAPGAWRDSARGLFLPPPVETDVEDGVLKPEVAQGLSAGYAALRTFEWYFSGAADRPQVYTQMYPQGISKGGRGPDFAPSESFTSEHLITGWEVDPRIRYFANRRTLL